MKAIMAERFLTKHYPGKILTKLPKEAATEMIVETEPTTEHSEYSVAVAAIYRSAMHHHNKTTETYRAAIEPLKIVVDGEEIILNPGDTYTIEPGKKHYAVGRVGEFALAKVISHPGWTPEDHIFDEKLTPEMVEGYIYEEQWDPKLIKEFEDRIEMAEHYTSEAALM